MSEHDTAIQSFAGERYHVGMYFQQFAAEDWDLRGLLGYGYGDHNSLRYAFLSGTSSTETADFHSNEMYGSLQARAMLLRDNWVRWVGQVGGAFIYHRQPGVTEQGNSSLTLTLEPARSLATIGTLGLTAQMRSLAAEYGLHPEAFIRYEHDFSANSRSTHEVIAALTQHPDDKETFVGQNRGENALRLGIGLAANATPNAWLNSSFIYTAHSHGHELGGYLNCEVTW